MVIIKAFWLWCEVFNVDKYEKFLNIVCGKCGYLLEWEDEFSINSMSFIRIFFQLIIVISQFSNTFFSRVRVLLM